MGTTSFLHPRTRGQHPSALCPGDNQDIQLWVSLVGTTHEGCWGLPQFLLCCPSQGLSASALLPLQTSGSKLVFPTWCQLLFESRKMPVGCVFLLKWH